MWDGSGSERKRKILRSAWPIEPYLVPSRCDTISLKYFVPHIFVFTINYFIILSTCKYFQVPVDPQVLENP